jgi:hypothetical protein
MKVTKALLALVVSSWCTAALAKMNCPETPQNISKDVLVDTEASVSGLRGLASASLKNKTETTTKNLFEKYPNADRLVVAQMIMSVYCQQIDASTTLSDGEKLDRLMTVNQTIIPLMTAPR